MKKFIFLSLFLITVFSLTAQVDSTKKSPQGWKFGGAVPAIAYDSDLGFRYGLLGNVYDWGDGTYYPDYKRSIYAEWSRTTKGSGVNRIQFDDRAFFNTKVRFFVDLAYLIEQSLDFYGFNGYQSRYFRSFEDINSDSYRSRVFYRHDRRVFKGTFDFQFPILDNKIRAFAGLDLGKIQVGSVDVDRLNRGKEPADMLPSQDTLPGLYENYINWGIIKPEVANGDFISVFKGGLIFDTRNNEALPTSGVWTELIVFGDPGIIGGSQYLQMALTHRQYFSLIKNRLSFAYRIVYQGKLAGDIPFYMLPYYYNTKEIRDAVGGSKTVRGILRNKVVADSYLFGNLEFRYRILNTRVFNQDFYIALSAFTDATRVVSPYNVNLEVVPTNLLHEYFNPIDSDIYKIHLGYGGGVRFAINENFIVAVDYGMTNNIQDGKSGLYIGLGWLF
jgi:hypothetical protein